MLPIVTNNNTDITSNKLFKLRPIIFIMQQQNNTIPLTQSAGLSNRHIAMHKDGRTLVDDSNISEGNLKTIIEPLLDCARALIEPYGGTIQYFKKISLDDLSKKLGNPEYIIGGHSNECACDLSNTKGLCKDANDTNDDINTRVSIKPDAGIIMWTYNGIQYPLYIGEDKVQGTNDKLHAANKPRQATGNAIERYFKNVRAEEMLCAHVPYFPSVVFASGCDFHSTETIAKRLEAGNYAKPNHYIEITPEKNATSTDVESEIKNMVGNISIRKQSVGVYSPFTAVSSVCIKAHKWDVMPHNSSLWRPHEYLAISKRIVELSIAEILVNADNVYDN